MKQAEFAELSREVMPVLDKLTEIAGQHGTAEKLVSITLSAEGYIHFTVHDSGMCLSRLKEKMHRSWKSENSYPRKWEERRTDMTSLNVKTEYSEYKDCKLRVGKYVEDNSVAVEIYNRWDGPIARVTTCLCDHSLAEDEAYVDTNNCPWAVALLEENGFAERTGRTRRSGYCEYPAMKFDRSKMAEFEEES